MDVMEQAGNVRASVRRRRRDHRADRAEATNEALRTENRVLRDQLARERSALEMALAASGPRKPRRIRRLLPLVIAAGGAYVAGTKAGRERYDQMRAWLSGRRDTMLAGQPDALREEAAGALVETGAAMERTADRVGDTLKQKAEKAGDLANDAAQKTGDAVAEGTARAGRKIVGS